MGIAQGGETDRSSGDNRDVKWPGTWSFKTLTLWTTR